MEMIMSEKRLPKEIEKEMKTLQKAYDQQTLKIDHK